MNEFQISCITGISLGPKLLLVLLMLLLLLWLLSNKLFVGFILYVCMCVRVWRMDPRCCAEVCM